MREEGLMATRAPKRTRFTVARKLGQRTLRHQTQGVGRTPSAPIGQAVNPNRQHRLCGQRVHRATGAMRVWSSSCLEESWASS
jgi:hypothetical protein